MTQTPERRVRAAEVLHVPQSARDDTLRLLQEARRKAVEQILVAEDAEAEARGERRKATALHKRYEQLLQEHSGQLRLPLEDT